MIGSFYRVKTDTGRYRIPSETFFQFMFTNTSKITKKNESSKELCNKCWITTTFDRLNTPNLILAGRLATVEGWREKKRYGIKLRYRIIKLAYYC